MNIRSLESVLTGFMTSPDSWCHHTKLTQIEGIIKAHLAKVNFDREIGSDDYAPGTCKTWKSFIGVYEGFDPLHQFGWDNIDRAFVARYINYLRSCQCSLH